MHVEALSLNKIFSSESKTEFEIGTLSDVTKDGSLEDKVFIGCGEKDFSAEEDVPKNKIKDLPKDELKKVKENIEKISESVIGKQTDIYQEMGFAPDKEDIDTIVTVTDRVKIQLARYSDNYEITGSNIDVSVLEEVTGSSAEATQLAAKLNDAYDMAKSIKNYDSGSQEYLLKNGLAPTINNIYIAEHSGAAQRENPSKLSQDDWSNISSQVKTMLENSGLEASQERMDGSKWIIENKIPLTPENVVNLEEIKSVDLNMTDEELMGKMMDSVMCGINPKDTLLSKGSDYLKRAQDAVEVIQNATLQDVEEIVSSGKELTIANLSSTSESAANLEDIKSVTAKKHLEETRLLMTVEANLKMLKKGISIEIEPLKNIIKELEAYENEYYGTLFSSVGYEGTKEDISTLKNTMDSVEFLKSVPAPIIGKLLYEDNESTVSSLTTDSKTAVSRYEEMGTQVRRDLGDSFTKAFNNIDSILEDYGLEVNSVNEKAVKILAYNNIDITEGNISKIKESYEEFSRLVNNLKPKTAAYLISEKINPLNTEISALNYEIDRINKEIDSPDEKYSDFLLKMEKNSILSKEERDAYIGTYRLLYLVEKNDFAAIGSLLNQGADVTLKNLATAVKSQKSQNMDYQVNDDFGGIKQSKVSDANILSQLRYFSNLVKDSKERLSGGTYQNDIQDISLEALAGEEEKYQKNLEKTQFTQLKALSDEAVQNLLDTGQKVTPQNLMLSGQIMGNKKGLFKNLDDTIDTDKYKFMDSLEDSETISKAYDELQKEVNDIVSTELENQEPDRLDIGKLKLMGQSATMLKNLSSNRQYHIPVDINGESCLIKLTIINSSQEKGKVTIETESEDLGKVSSEIRVNGEAVNGIVLTDSSDSTELLNQNIEDFRESLKEMGYEKADINVCYQAGIKDNMWKDNQEKTQVDTRNIYKIAKLFIEQVVQKRG